MATYISDKQAFNIDGMRNEDSVLQDQANWSSHSYESMQNLYGTHYIMVLLR